MNKDKVIANIKEVARFGLIYDVDNYYLLELILDIANDKTSNQKYTEQKLKNMYLS